MQIHNLSRSSNPWVLMTYTAAGSGDTQTSAVLDTNQDQAAYFVVILGTVSSGGGGTIKVQHSADNNVTDPFTDIAGSGFVSAIGNTLQGAIIDIYRPQKRYLQVVILRGSGGNTVISSVFGLTYHVGYAPEMAGTTSTTGNIANITWLSNPGSGAA